MTARASRMVRGLRAGRTRLVGWPATSTGDASTPQPPAFAKRIRLRLWQVVRDRYVAVTPSAIDSEKQLEDLIEANPDLLDAELLVVGRQVHAGGHGQVDLLAIDRRATVWVIELKRDRSGRDVTGQLVDYGAWAARLTRRELVRIYSAHSNGRDLERAFREKFDAPLPSNSTGTHVLVLVASIVDRVTRENLDYLIAAGHPVRVALFQHFKVNGVTLIARAGHADDEPGHLSLRDESAISPSSLEALAQRSKLWTAHAARVQLHDYQDGLAEIHEQARAFWDRFSPLFQWDFLMPEFLLAVHEKWRQDELAAGRQRMSLTQTELFTNLRVIVGQSGEWAKDYRRPAQFMKLHEPLAQCAGWVWDGTAGQSHGFVRRPR